MTDLPSIALSFIRECMGHYDAAFTSDRSFVGYNWSTPADDDQDCALFDFGDLNAVMEAVKAWGDNHNGLVETSSHKSSIVARVRLLDIEGQAYWHQAATLQQALLDACIDAARRLKR